MPRLALDDDEEVLLAGWLVEEGAELREGQAAVEIETSKASMEVEVEQDGVLALRLRQPGDRLMPGDVIALVAGPEESYDIEALRAAHVESTEDVPVVADVQVRSAPPAAATVAAEPPVTRWTDPLVSGGFLVGVPPAPGHTGTSSRVGTDAQVRPGRIVPTAPITRELSRHRAAVARVMTASVAIPQFSVQREIEVDAAVDLVSRLRKLGFAATLTDVFCRASARALKQHPDLNSWLVSDRIELHAQVSISLAIDGPAGVVAPVIHRVDELGWAALAEERRRVVQGARAARLHSDHLAGGTFSISNVGPVGGDLVIPLLTPPQVAILGLGRIRAGASRPAVLSAVLVADHRAIDGADAARFLVTFDEVLRDVDSLLMGDVEARAGG